MLERSGRARTVVSHEQIADAILEARSTASDAIVTYGYGRCALATNRDFWDEDAGRSRATWKPLQDSAPTEATVRVWCQDPTSAGIALVTSAAASC